MKPIFLFKLLILAILGTTSMHSIAQTNFQLCNTKVAKDLLEENDYKSILDNKVRSINSAEWRNDQENPGTKRVIEDYARKDYGLVPSEVNTFAQAVELAHGQHRPLIISPDMIWLVIMQGFSKHVDVNGDSLRDLFVDFEGKKMLNLRMDDYVKGSPYHWETVFPEFEKQIGYYTSKEVSKLLGHSFSTSTSVEKATFQITIMDAMSSFFNYSGTVMCGIPEITLEGTPEDWEKIEELTKELDGFGLKWWTEPLLPVLHEFTEASKGNVNKKFWAKIYDQDQVIEDVVCAKIKHNYISGWLLNFYPYIKGKKNGFITGDIQLPRNVKPQKGTGIKTEDLPQGLSKAVFLLDDNGTYYNMEFIAGFMGIKQDHQTKALRPEISWAVIDTQTKPDAKLVKSYNEFIQKRKTN